MRKKNNRENETPDKRANRLLLENERKKLVRNKTQHRPKCVLPVRNSKSSKLTDESFPLESEKGPAVHILSSATPLTCSSVDDTDFTTSRQRAAHPKLKEQIVNLDSINSRRSHGNPDKRSRQGQQLDSVSNDCKASRKTEMPVSTNTVQQHLVDISQSTSTPLVRSSISEFGSATQAQNALFVELTQPIANLGAINALRTPADPDSVIGWVVLNESLNEIRKSDMRRCIAIYLN
jgi:hypothetical protein